jgi:hypothetical protein
VSLHDPNFSTDKHLQTALRHAPDQDLAPSERVRESVLIYANNAVKPAPENWLKRGLSAFTNWRIKTWQVAGMGALASMLLVIVMVREQMPEEPVWAESDDKSIAQAEVTQNNVQGKAEAPAANAPEAYQAAPQVEEPAAPMREKAKAKPDITNRNLATEQAPAKELAETTQIAAAPELPKTAEVADAAEAVQTPEAAVVAAAPEPAPPAELETKKSLSRARQATGSVMNEAPISQAPMSQALNIDTLLKQGGEATAKQDIAAGNLRILKFETEACEKPNKLEAHDADTNYTVLVICDSEYKTRGELLQSEVDAYNQTMRNWRQTH